MRTVESVDDTWCYNASLDTSQHLNSMYCTQLHIFPQTCIIQSHQISKWDKLYMKVHNHYYSNSHTKAKKYWNKLSLTVQTLKNSPLQLEFHGYFHILQQPWDVLISLNVFLPWCSILKIHVHVRPLVPPHVIKSNAPRILYGRKPDEQL